jgi:hypothetical protein
VSAWGDIPPAGAAGGSGTAGPACRPGRAAGRCAVSAELAALQAIGWALQAVAALLDDADDAAAQYAHNAGGAAAAAAGRCRQPPHARMPGVLARLRKRGENR